MSALDKLQSIKGQTKDQAIFEALEELTKEYADLMKHVSALEKTALEVEQYGNTIKSLNDLLKQIFILLNTDSPEDLEVVKTTLKKYIFDIASVSNE